MKNIMICCAIGLLLPIYLNAQSTSGHIRVQVALEHSDWIYQLGEKAKFNVSVLKNNIPLENASIDWTIAEEMMQPSKTGSDCLKKGTIALDGGTMRNPGFLRCVVKAKYRGRIYEGMATAAFNPEKILPTQVEPADFDTFWQKSIAANSEIPMDPIVTLLPERCTAKVDVYQVGLQNYRYGARLYGILCVPKAAGTYPAILHFPGAGVRPYSGDIGNAENGFITFQIEIHGIPHDMPTKLYSELFNGVLYDYPQIKLDNPDDYYYKKVYLGCLRAVDFIFGLSKFDKQNICAHGGSQGGALSIVTAALDSRITHLVAHFPAMCDLTGYLHGRAGGWPHLFRNAHDAMNTQECIRTTAYYDVVNFAKRLKIPGFYTLGYNDQTCPPTSTFSAYNVITAPKEIFVVEEAGHKDYPEQWEEVWKWVNSHLKK